MFFTTTDRSLLVQEIVLFLQIMITDFDLSVHYSEGGVASFKVGFQWRDKVFGMCGTCNSDDADEFTLPDGSQVGVLINLLTLMEASTHISVCKRNICLDIILE